MNKVAYQRNTYAIVNLNNLKHNVKILKEIAGELFFCPMVKSNAYGHGDQQVVSALIQSGVDHVGVALIEEAISLRSFTDISILIFGAIKPEGFEQILKHSLTPVITNWQELRSFSKLNIKDYPIHIKFNTGMNRFGFRQEEASKIRDFLSTNKSLKLAGVCSHLLDGENIDSNKMSSYKQVEMFKEIVKLFPNVTKHLYNSSAFLNMTFNNMNFNDVGSRLGLAIYGCYPSSKYKENKFSGLKPVMSLQSEVVEYQKIKAGETVSYGGHWTAKRFSTIGVVPIGYTDSYGREFSNKGKMLYRGQFVPVVGKICMDYTMVDLTDVLQDDDGKIGEEIVLFGKQGNLLFGVEEFAEQVDKIPYEVLTTLGRRVPRYYIGD